MTDETTQDNTQVADAQPQDQGVNISIEQILAAVINTVGNVTVPIEKLITNYGNQQIAVNQNEDKSVVFSLVDAPQPTSDATDSDTAADSAE